MKFVDLEGNVVGINLSSLRKVSSSKSEVQSQLGRALREAMSGFDIYEEFPCVGTRLKIDFYVPTLGLAVEMDGRQHGEYVPRFHKSRRGFARSQDNDAHKEEWCRLNGIKLIRVVAEDLDSIEDIIYEGTGDD